MMEYPSATLTPGQLPPVPRYGESTRVVAPGDMVRLFLPHSEACMSMRVAGDVHVCRIDPDGVRVIDRTGRAYPPVTHGEAGLTLATYLDDAPRTYRASTVGVPLHKRDAPSHGHVDYPHTPGYLYDCPACENACHCSPLPGHTPCVRCGDDSD